MTAHTPLSESEKVFPHGLVGNLQAPFSGAVGADVVGQALAKLPETKKELREVWISIQTARLSGLAPTFDNGPLDDAIRNGEWRPELQSAMPTAGGLPGSKGVKVPWRYSSLGSNQTGNTHPKGVEVKPSVKRLIQIFEKRK